MMARQLLAGAGAALAMLAAPAQAYEIDWGADTEVLAIAEMDDLRGGFMVAPGIEVQFGAQITTYFDGQPALSTQLTWTDAGAVVESTIGALGRQLSTMSEPERAELGLGGLDGLGGVLVSDAAGVTAMVHNLTNGALQNIIINDASGRDLRQEIDVTLTLPGFEVVQAGLILERIGLRLDQDLRGITFGN